MHLGRLTIIWSWLTSVITLGICFTSLYKYYEHNNMCIKQGTLLRELDIWFWNIFSNLFCYLISAISATLFDLFNNCHRVVLKFVRFFYNICRPWTNLQWLNACSEEHLIYLFTSLLPYYAHGSKNIKNRKERRMADYIVTRK